MVKCLNCMCPLASVMLWESVLAMGVRWLWVRGRRMLWRLMFVSLSWRAGECWNHPCLLTSAKDRECHDHLWTSPSQGVEYCHDCRCSLASARQWGRAKIGCPARPSEVVGGCCVWTRPSAAAGEVGSTQTYLPQLCLWRESQPCPAPPADATD